MKSHHCLEIEQQVKVEKWLMPHIRPGCSVTYGQGHVLFAGEIAGFLNPMGEGISAGMESGYCAANAIANHFDSKVFMITAVLMVACCSITYFCITQFAPYIYTHDFSAIDEELPYFVEDISHFTKEEALLVIEDYCNQIVEKNDEFVFRLFQSNSEELKQFNKDDTSQWCRLTFSDSAEEYIVFFSKNTEKESQVVEALQKAVPVLSVVIIIVSIIAAFFYTIYMTTPIVKRVSLI